jgi:hypothetical protein
MRSAPGTFHRLFVLGLCRAVQVRPLRTRSVEMAKVSLGNTRGLVPHLLLFGALGKGVNRPFSFTSVLIRPSGLVSRQSKNHTNRNQSYKAHRNGIKKPRNHVYQSQKGVSTSQS